MEPGSSRHEGGARKRLKISRNGAPAPVTLASPSIQPGGSGPSGERSKMADPPACGGSCHHEHTLTSLHSDVDAMRSLVTCQICHRFMYEPYVLACGHTYCYSCLTQWLGNNRKKSCPDCRANITQQPTPSYIIRELVVLFASRDRLLPDGETTEEHSRYAKEEAEMVAKDKANSDERTGGLFRGSFRRGRQPLLPLHDPGDGVDRCPHCHWEVEDGYCNQCGIPVGDDGDLGFSDYDGDSITSDDGHDLDVVYGVDGPDFISSDEDPGDEGTDDLIHAAIAGTYFGPRPNNAPVQQRSRAPRRIGPLDESSDLDSEDEHHEDEHDGSLDGFIVGESPNDEESSIDQDSSDGVELQEAATQPVRRRRQRPTVVISDDDDDEVAEIVSTTMADHGSEEGSDGETPVPVLARQIRPRCGAPYRRPVAISSDEDSSEDEGTVQNEPEDPALDLSVSETVSDDGSAPPDEYASEQAGSFYDTYGDDFDDADGTGEDAEEDGDGDGSEFGWGPDPSALSPN